MSWDVALPALGSDSLVSGSGSVSLRGKDWDARGPLRSSAASGDSTEGRDEGRAGSNASSSDFEFKTVPGLQESSDSRESEPATSVAGDEGAATMKAAHAEGGKASRPRKCRRRIGCLSASSALAIGVPLEFCQGSLDSISSVRLATRDSRGSWEPELRMRPVAL
ncbi:unnamed protein product [Effrenium voratum]|uniref:Uncharacterized protein n=1 Tax=Effrenium voratum TaxID=2562239 RepID=A0AA36IST3_9DINO|nr:unnamed protein product [Effrenium voratum]